MSASTLDTLPSGMIIQQRCMRCRSRTLVARHKRRCLDRAGCGSGVMTSSSASRSAQQVMLIHCKASQMKEVPPDATDYCLPSCPPHVGAERTSSDHIRKANTGNIMYNCGCVRAGRYIEWRMCTSIAPESVPARRTGQCRGSTPDPRIRLSSHIGASMLPLSNPAAVILLSWSERLAGAPVGIWLYA